MKSLAPNASSARHFLAVLLAGAVAFQSAAGQDTAKGYIQQNEADQQDVRQHTTALAAQVQAMIDELAANGISGDDIKVLETTKAVLNNLSAKEMARVIASLQKAGDSAGTDAGRQSVVDAYAGQKGIILEFHQILKDYEQRQAALELPAKFKELTDRQTQTMWTTAEVASTSAGKSASEMTTMQQTTAQIVADKDALSSDVNMAQQQLDKAVDGSTGSEGNAMKQAQQDLKSGAVQKALDKANADLKAGHLLQATSEQKTARDALRQVTKDLNPSTDAVEALASFAADLAKLIDDQKSLLDETNAGATTKPRPIGLDEKQAVLVDKTNSLQEDMLSMSPVVSGMVKDALTPMQLSRAALGLRGAFEKAAISETDAIAKLEEAQTQMQKQLADAKKAADDAAKDSTAKLQDLQKQIQNAMQAQQQVSQASAQGAPTAAAAQQQLQQQTAALQQTAQPLSLAASQALANAASQMAKAQQAATDPSNAANAQAAQAAAQQALAQANQAVNQQIAANQTAAVDPNALATAANALDTAQSAVSQAIAASTPPAATPPSTNAPSATPPTPNATAANPPSTNAPSATPPAPSATAANNPTATPPATAPSPSATAANAPAAGQPAAGTPAPSQPAAGAPNMAAAAAALAKAAQATATAAAAQGLPAAAAAAVQSAQAAIATGQKAAAQSNAPGTAAAAAAAQASLAQAQAAVAVAQAGLPASGAPMAGGPPQPGTPGKPDTNPTPPGPDTASDDGAKTVTGGSTDKGTLHDVSGNGSFISVAARDRTAIGQTQGEKRPQEYAPMIDQYMKNLSDQSSSTSP